MPETIGQQLKQARLARNLSIEKVVQATHIRAHSIAALEADDFESLPSATQARGFLKLYADYLGLSLENMFAQQRSTLASDLGPGKPVDEAHVLVGETNAAKQKMVAPEIQPKKVKERKTARSVKIEPEAAAEPLQAPGTAPITKVTKQPAKAEPFTLENQPEQGAANGADSAQSTVSQVVFNAIGKILRERREGLSLSLDEIERHTHIRRHYLEALENGQFDHLPSSVQARGMLNNYAHFLDLDVESLLLEFANGLQAQLAERQPKPETAPESGLKSAIKFTIPASLRRILSPDILVGGGVLILLVIFAIWGTGRIIRQNTAFTPQPTAPSISNMLLSSPVAGEPISTGTTDPGTSAVIPEAGATQEITLPPPGESPVQVVLVAARSAWVKVVVDNLIVYEGRVMPGTAYVYDADTQIEILTGDGSAVSIIYNQSNLGAMGAYGEVVDRIYTATAILIPTATYTPSPTTTFTSTITPRPSATPRPSNTPRPTATPRP